MTASTISDARVASISPSFGRLAGLRALLRKDATEWVRGRRVWVVLAISSVFMVLTAANGWIKARIAESLPPDVAPPAPGSLVPLDNIIGAVSAQVFVLATIFAVASLLVAERDSGTLAWVASKPVTRSSIWLSKWISASAILVVAAGLIPLALTVGLVVVLYGVPPVGAVVGLAVGIAALVTFFAAVGLAAGTVLPGQPAIAAAGFGVFALTPVLSAIVPFDVAPFLPTSILPWPAMAMSGEAVPWVTPVAWLAITTGLVLLALRRMARIQL
jgi:ABC-2 type transport system permease protein